MKPQDATQEYLRRLDVILCNPHHHYGYHIEIAARIGLDHAVFLNTLLELLSLPQNKTGIVRADDIEDAFPFYSSVQLRTIIDELRAMGLIEVQVQSFKASAYSIDIEALETLLKLDIICTEHKRADLVRIILEAISTAKNRS